MCSGWCGAVLLGTVVLCLLAAEDGNTSLRKPFGPKMCEELCIRTRDRWSTCNFTASDLSCHIDKEKKRYSTKGQKIIHINDRIQQRLNTRKLPKRQDKMKKLLIFPCKDGGRYLHGRQFFFQNNSVASYKSIISRCISAVAYNPLNRKLVVANWGVRTLSFLHADKGIRTTIKRHIRIKGVTVDSSKQAVFMITSSPHKGISAMTTEGKNFTSLTSLRKCVLGDIAADVKRSLIYVSCLNEKIHTVTYQGIHKGIIAGPIWVFGPFGISLEEDSLYFVQESASSVFKMFLSDSHTVTKITKLKSEVYSMFVTNNAVYVSLSYQNNVVVAIRKSGDVSKVKFTGYEEEMIYGVHMCCIP